MGVIAEAMLSRVLGEAVNRIARKVAEGKKLSDQEIAILHLNIIMRSNEKRFEAINKRFDDPKEYVDRGFADLKEYADRRFNDLREYTDKKFESIDRRFGELREYVDKKVNDLKD